MEFATVAEFDAYHSRPIPEQKPKISAEAKKARRRRWSKDNPELQYIHDINGRLAKGVVLREATKIKYAKLILIYGDRRKK